MVGRGILRNPAKHTHCAEHPWAHQVGVILDQFIVLVRPFITGPEDFSGECSQRLLLGEQQFSPSSPCGFILAVICKLYILESIT